LLRREVGEDEMENLERRVFEKRRGHGRRGRAAILSSRIAAARGRKTESTG